MLPTILLPFLAAAAVADAEPPVLDRVAVTPKRMHVGGSVRIRHRLSEPATLIVRVRPGGAALVGAPAGVAETQLSGTKLLPGRHRVTVTAVDRAGNASRRRTATFRVVR
jgi:hypothetical protein